MREIKYINHIVRGGFLYIAFYVILNLIFGFTRSINEFFLGFLTLTIGYSAVYFLNDYTDRDEDIKNKKANLYITIDNHNLFLLLATACVILGFIGSAILSANAFFFLLALYILNILYSVKPFRLRDLFLVREITIFVINIAKSYFAIFLMGFEPAKSPLSIVLMTSSLLAALTVVYKRQVDIRNTNIALYIFGIIAVLSWGISLWLYPQIFLVIVPVLPMAIFLHFKYKNKPVPNSKYLLAYVVYFSLIMLIAKVLSH